MDKSPSSEANHDSMSMSPSASGILNTDSHSHLDSATPMENAVPTQKPTKPGLFFPKPDFDTALHASKPVEARDRGSNATAGAGDKTPAKPASARGKTSAKEQLPRFDEMDEMEHPGPPIAMAKKRKAVDEDAEEDTFDGEGVSPAKKKANPVVLNTPRKRKVSHCGCVGRFESRWLIPG